MKDRLKVLAMIVLFPFAMIGIIFSMPFYKERGKEDNRL